MTHQNTHLPHCGLLRRLGAIFYDSLLLSAVLLLASLIALPLLGDAPSRPAMLLFRIYLVLSAFGFLAWFWTHGGQTLGMRVWHIRLQNHDGGPITLWQALLRFLIAIVSWLAFGLGFLWSLFNKDKLTWHDRYSMSELVVIPKEQARK
ncbi:MAG: RDD family protein [Pseudomonadota bacterium]